MIQLTLTAVDGGKPPKSGAINIIVNIIDATTIFLCLQSSLQSANSRKCSIGTSVITVHASDATMD